MVFGLERKEDAELPYGWKSTRIVEVYGECQDMYRTVLHYENQFTGDVQRRRPTDVAPGAPPLNLPNDFIACELLDRIPLTTMNGHYSALSYCAGSPNETAMIMIDGMWFNTFANLEHSIESVRQHWEKSGHGNNRDLLLWIDQACINQSDHAEKSCQVAFMREIYQQAEQVFICLSTEPTATREFPIKAPVGIASLKVLRNEACESTQLFSNVDIQSRLLHHIASQLETETGSSELMKWLILMEELISAPWWTRAWVRLNILFCY
jgi:hypothetical protein